MAEDKDNKPVGDERRKGPTDRRTDNDRRGGDRIVDTEEVRRKNPDRRK